MNAPARISAETRQSFERNRAAIDAALLSKGVAHSGIAGPDGCILCGNTIEVHGYDCWACESAFNAPVRDTAALAAMLAHALEMRIAHEGGVS